jgi:hypothetical protein
MVEDHPLDYLLFEGVIPKGNYGAGPVMVWDEGTYHVPGVANREKSEQLVNEGLAKGRLHVVFHGKKLKGEYALVRTSGQQKNGWLFFNKGKPREPQENEDRSVLSDRTMDEIARGEPPRQPKSQFDLSDAPKAPMPHAVQPMLANPVDEPFDGSDWIFEVKWDGYRAIAEVTSPPQPPSPIRGGGLGGEVARFVSGAGLPEDQEPTAFSVVTRAASRRAQEQMLPAVTVEIANEWKERSVDLHLHGYVQ